MTAGKSEAAHAFGERCGFGVFLRFGNVFCLDFVVAGFGGWNPLVMTKAPRGQK